MSTTDALSQDGTPRAAHRIRPIDAAATDEVTLVATRMRQTLIEVLGADTGAGMYTMDWLVQRVLSHLDPAWITGQVYVAEDADGHITGHTIVRIERDEAGQPFGLFSTTYVEPESRKQAIASSLLDQGEAWMRAHGLTRGCTYTSESNTKLIRLYEKHGYAITGTAPEKHMVILSRSLDG